LQRAPRRGPTFDWYVAMKCSAARRATESGSICRVRGRATVAYFGSRSTVRMSCSPHSGLPAPRHVGTPISHVESGSDRAGFGPNAGRALGSRSRAKGPRCRDAEGLLATARSARKAQLNDAIAKHELLVSRRVPERGTLESRRADAWRWGSPALRTAA